MRTNSLDIRVYNSVAEAPRYELPEFKASNIDHACVIRKGTEADKSTVDLIFVDESGQKFITMLTGNLVKNLAAIIGAE